jgi:hypothetical protein
MRYAPCVFCRSATAYELGEPVCGTCELMIGNTEQVNSIFTHEFKSYIPLIVNNF